MTFKPYHFPVFISAIFALALLMFSTPGCAESGHCGLALDADVPAGCFPDDPCCEADSRLSPAGAPCGTGAQGLCYEINVPTIGMPSCSGTSALCDGPVIQVPWDRVACLDGYQCDANGPACTWIGVPEDN